MVFRRRVARKRPGLRRKRVLNRRRRMNVHKRVIPNKQYAHTTESYEVEDLAPNQLYGAYFDMSYFPRSSAIGQNYQEYKINKIQLKFEPYYNTFQDMSGNTTAPQLLTVMDRTGRNDAWNKQNLEELGARPYKFVSNTTRTYKPNTLVVVQNNSTNPQEVLTGQTQNNDVPLGANLNTASTAQSVQVQFNKWYSTAYDCDASNIPPIPGSGSTAVNQFAATAWYGLMFWIDQQTSVPGVPGNVGRLTVIASISFRGPALSKTKPVSAGKISI